MENLIKIRKGKAREGQICAVQLCKDQTQKFAKTNLRTKDETENEQSVGYLALVWKLRIKGSVFNRQ